MIVLKVLYGGQDETGIKIIKSLKSFTIPKEKKKEIRPASLKYRL